MHGDAEVVSSSEVIFSSLSGGLSLARGWVLSLDLVPDFNLIYTIGIVIQ